MKRHGLLAALLLLVFLLAPVSTASAAAQRVNATPKPATVKIKAVTVNNAKEFYKALRSNRTITLLPGDYNTEKVVKSSYAFYDSKDGVYDFADGVFDVTGATLKNLKNVKIVGKATELLYSSRVYFGNVYEDYVLILNNCKNVTFENLSFGHKGSPDFFSSCVTGVILLVNCQNITFKNCDIFGCGYTGLDLIKCSNIVVDQSQIHDCSSSAFQIYKSDLTVSNSKIYNNGNDDAYAIFKLGEFYEDSKIAFSQCDFYNNGDPRWPAVSDYALFHMWDGTLTLDQCTYANNYYD